MMMVLPPCVVDGRSRNPLYYYYKSEHTIQLAFNTMSSNIMMVVPLNSKQAMWLSVKTRTSRITMMIPLSLNTQYSWQHPHQFFLHFCAWCDKASIYLLHCTENVCSCSKCTARPSTAVRARGGDWLHHPLLSLVDHTATNLHTNSSEGPGWTLSASSTAVIGGPHSR